MFVTPDVRFDHAHMDIVGPLPASQGFRYLLTVVDRFTRWPEAVPLMDITATSVARAFVFGWESRLCVPSVLTTDRGRQFESTVLRELTCPLGCTRIRTSFSQWFSGTFPSSNESFIESMHNYHWLAGFTTFSPSWLVDGPHGCSTAELKLVYGTTLRVPGEFFAPGTDPPHF